MEYRQLGKTGLQVSSIGLGTNNFGNRVGQKGASLIIDHALDVGINMIDTSNSYGGGYSEKYIGEALKGKREKAIIATKVSSRIAEGPNNAGNSRKHIMAAIEVSLKRLQTDYIDLYQIHWIDENTPVEETLGTLDDLVHQGKVRYIGCSNFAAWQVCEAIWMSKTKDLESFASIQPRYSIMDREIEQEMIPLCSQYGVGILPYYPLANGFLTGKYKRSQQAPKGTRLSEDDRGMFTDNNFDLLEKLVQFCNERNHSVLELAFSWLLAKPEISSVIAGATKVEQVIQNSRAVEWQLSNQDLEALDLILP